MLKRASDLPNTSQPCDGDFPSIYAKLAQEPETVVSIHVAGQRKGVINAA